MKRKFLQVNTSAQAKRLLPGGLPYAIIGCACFEELVADARKVKSCTSAAYIWHTVSNAAPSAEADHVKS